MYHIIIKQERRTQPERMAVVISAAIPTEQPDTYLVGEPQLHVMTTRSDIYSGRIKSAQARGVEEVALILQEQAAMGIPPDFSDPQYVMVAEWDGISPYVICHKGDYAVRNMAYAGWPDLTREQYEAVAISTS